MNLFTPVGGLGGTHVTWEDIEEDLQRELNTVATFGPNKTFKTVGDGRGFLSRVLLIDPDWQHKDMELPEKFIVKIASQLAMLELTGEFAKKGDIEDSFSKPEFMAALEYQQKKLHNNEVILYEHLKRIPEGKLPMIKIFSTKKFSEHNPVKGYIVMEFVEDLVPLHVFNNVPPHSLRKALRAKAVLEAMSLDFSEEEKNEFLTNVYSELFGAIFKKEMFADMVKIFQNFASGKMADKATKMGKLLPEIVDLPWADRLADEMGMERVLCHGDLWSTNMLWKQNGGELDVVALIDYQTAHMGCPAVDLVRLFSACLSGKDRQEHWEELVEEFYGYLKEEVGNKEMPYTLQQIKEAYLRFMPLGIFMIVTGIGPLYDVLCKNPNEEQRQKGLDLVVEKTECLLDDVFFYHERNKNLTKHT
ncbi:unnamed protein product [Cylicocyclus nassatus]|uniref:CHK kinase-like domain-containing protein n=1 Tax=Cylicocyclus nassatus TaxID=53992 RepID=A0AA36GEX3_CYLNA|nr:unnamed protein product [Cylicocyclus nassatus]